MNSPAKDVAFAGCRSSEGRGSTSFTVPTNHADVDSIAQSRDHRAGCGARAHPLSSPPAFWFKKFTFLSESKARRTEEIFVAKQNPTSQNFSV
jgi:hypothetical protein